jgi:hypothetical protein
MQELEEKGRDICHMEVGQPSLGAPEHVLMAATKSMVNTTLGYTAVSLHCVCTEERESLFHIVSMRFHHI